ncbi:WD repeat-containing and planar cell polarity effector protein fritz homolog [Epargyreus clarus]|uniref:WD repeat-containing and planar cell polarity effector protein fritz homolog n=1 Tax=Epargyreus clarus TaxID=520877 RepID=UPI003C305FED
MFNYDVKFLTCDDLIHLKSGDFKSFKYDTKKRQEETVYDSGKRDFCERRGGHWRVPRPRQLKQLEAKIREKSVVACEWTNDTTATLVFSSGAIAYLTVKPSTLDITQILFDRYCVGKLTGQNVSSVVLCKTHLLFMHTDRIATMISFGKAGGSFPSRISEKDPHLQSLELGGGGRRTERRVTWCENSSGVRVLVWSATAAEPAPWSPIPQDHANMHLYQINGQQVTLIAYHQLENEVLSVEISHKLDNIVHIVQQTSCQKNVVNLDWLRYDVPSNESRVAVTKMSSLRENVTRVSLPAPARLARRSACDTRLLTACIDGSIHVIHHIAGLTNTTRAGFIPTDVRWTGELIVAAEEAGRLQCFDRALSLLHHHTKCLDLTSYLREARRIQILATRNVTGGPLILATFTGGPLTLLRITHPRLLSAWIRSGRTTNAVSLLRAMDWEREGPECLRAVDEILRGALRRSNSFESGEQHAQAALGAFLAPSVPLSTTALKYGPPLYDLARKFFHHLLRRGRVEKALCLGVDVCAWDLFADARWAATRRALPRLAAEAAAAARHHARDARPARSDSECSDSCSQCSSHSYSGSDDEASASKPTKTNPPPLPRVPMPSHPTVLPVPIIQNEQYSTNSIRPNLHQYVDRDNTIWGTNIKDDNFISAKDYEHFKPLPTAQNMRWSSMDNVLLNMKKPTKQSDAFTKPHSELDVVPRQQDERLVVSHFKHLYQTELREETPDASYRFHSNNNLYLSTSNFNGRYRHENNFWTGSRPPEKNKVKFSDTVTIAVMSEPASPEAPSPPPEPRRKFPGFPASLPLADNVPQKPPKIKVVHFGMV